MIQYSGNFFLSGGNNLEKEGTAWRPKAARGLLCLLLLLGVACTEHVKAGYSGILDADAEFKTADEIELRWGKVYYNPFTEEVHTFPHAMQRVTWNFDYDSRDDSKEITFSSFGGAVVKSAMEMGYTYKSGRIPHVFVALRNTKGLVVEDYMWRTTHESINECAGQLPIEAIYGSQKVDISTCALEKIRQKSFIRDNFTISYLNFVGKFQFTDMIARAIENDISVRINSKANEIKNAARRRGEILDAKSKKEVMRIEAEGLDRLNASLTDNLLIYLEKEPLSVPEAPVQPGPWSSEQYQ
jgi:hypothetical protein